ncbi:MAG: GntP family permease [Geminicoccaceae bacterium]
MGLLGILLALALLVVLAFRGWSVLLLAPLAALLAAAFAGEPLLAHWTQTFMGTAARFVAQFFPLFLLGAVFGKLMEDSGAVAAIARALGERLGPERAVLAVVLAGAAVTYGGVSLFVAFFVLVPMAQALFARGGVPRRLMPAAVMLGTSTFTMSALPGTPAIQNAIPMPVLGTNPFAAPGLGVLAALVMLGFGLRWLGRLEAAERGTGPAATGAATAADALADDRLRELVTVAREFDPAEIERSPTAADGPTPLLAALPLVVVVTVNFLMAFLVLPRLDTSFLAEERFGPTTLAAVAGVWAVVVALAASILVLLATSGRRVPDLRRTLDAGANAAVLPILSVASLVGFGAVVAALPAFAAVREAVMGIGGGPLVSMTLAVNTLAALTGSASGGLTIALDALGPGLLELARAEAIDPALLHRIAVLGAGTLDSLPHNGAVVTLLALCGVGHREGYGPLFVVAILGPVLALVLVLGLGSAFGAF